MLPEKPLKSYYEEYYEKNLQIYIDKYGSEEGPLLLKKEIENLQTRRMMMYKEGEDLGEALNLMQRRQRGRVMKRFKAKIARSRARAAKRIAPTDKLMNRARKAAKAIIRKRFAGKLGENYANLTPSQKETIDKRLESKKSLVGKIAKRIFPKIKAKEMARWRGRNASKLKEALVFKLNKGTSEADWKKDVDLVKSGKLSSKEIEQIMDKWGKRGDYFSSASVAASKKKMKENVEFNEGVVRPGSGILDKSFNELKKRTKNTPAEYKKIAQGKDFEIWVSYGGSLKRMAHYVVKDDKIVGTGWTAPSALKDAKLKVSDVTAYSKYAKGSILNTIKESLEASVSEAKVNAMTVIFDKLDKKNIEAFKNAIQKFGVKIIKAAGKMVVVDVKDSEEKDYLVSAADEVGVGIDIKMGAKI